MNIEQLRLGVTRSDMRAASAEQLSSLSSHLGVELVCFRRHIVEGESVTTTFRAPVEIGVTFDLCMEGALFIYLKDEAPPSIDAEFVLFSRGERIGPRSNMGGAYVSILYEFDKGWRNQGWLGDSPEYWERLSEPSTSEYGEVTETWDPNK